MIGYALSHFLEIHHTAALAVSEKDVSLLYNTDYPRADIAAVTIRKI
jgi:hypothetical protein